MTWIRDELQGTKHRFLGPDPECLASATPIPTELRMWDKTQDQLNTVWGTKCMLSSLEEEQVEVKQRNAKLFCKLPVVCYTVY